MIEENDFLSDIDIVPDSEISSDSDDNDSNHNSSSTKKKIFKDAKYCSYENIHGRKCTTRILKKNINNDFCTKHMRQVELKKKKEEEEKKNYESTHTQTNSSKQLNEWGVDIPLFLHQQNSVKKMIYIEENPVTKFTESYNKYRIDERDSTQISTTLNSRVRILSDKVGSGKTLTTVSFLSCIKDKEDALYKPIHDEKFNIQLFPTILMKENIFVSEFSEFFSRVSVYDRSINILNINVIVCASSVYNQWINELNHSNLKYKVIFKNKDFDHFNYWILNTYDVILVTYNRYNEFICMYNMFLDSYARKFAQTTHAKGYSSQYILTNLYIKRIIFDELQVTGKLLPINSYKYWVVSGSLKYNDSMYFNYNERDKRTNMLCNVLYNIQNKHINIGNSEEIIAQSYKQAEMIQHTYDCYIRDFNVLKNYLPNEVKRMIAAGDISSAVSYLGGQRENKKLSDIIIEKEEYSLRQLEASLIYYTQLENTNKVDEIKEKIEKAKSSLENLKNKIQEIENEECPVCYDDFNNQKILTNCCKFVLCNNCIKNLVLTTNKCPFCRTQIDMKSLIVSTTDDIKESDEKKSFASKKSKPDTVIEIINSKPNGKFLLFSEFWQTFSPISEVLTTNNISWAEIKGTTDTKQKNIKLFKEGKIKVLFLNARHDGTGINLPETTDIILYHKVSSDSLETQIFGRALRLGRTSVLHVHRLLADGENFIQNSSSARLNLINQFDNAETSLNNAEDDSDSDSDIDIDIDIGNELEEDIREPEESPNTLNEQEIEINNIMNGLNRSDFSSLSELKDFATAIYISRSQS